MDRNYTNYIKLPFKVLRTHNDLYYPITNPNVIRRNYSFRKDKIIQQSVLLDLGKVCLLSKLHFKPSHPKIVKIEIGNDDEQNKKKKVFITIENEIEIVGGVDRVMNIGSLPCRYLKITFLKGCPIMDYSTIELYGFKVNELQKIFKEDTIDLIYYNSYNFIYECNEPEDN